MFFIIGTVTVFGCVISGYVLHHGDLAILWQPTEVLIICGAAIGSFMIANPGSVLKKCLASLKYLFKGQGNCFRNKRYCS